MLPTETKMLEDYYGFSENPFGPATNPRCHFSSASHASALELVQDAIRRRAGDVAITGQIGIGKTTFCRAARKALKEKIGK